MAKIPTFSEVSIPAVSDLLYLVDVSDTTDDATGSSRKLTLERLFGLLCPSPGGRLTLTTGNPVPAADATGTAIIYWTPYIHDGITLWDGTRWQFLRVAEKSVSITGLNSGRPYDVFGYINAGTLALEVLTWTNDTTRATAVTIQDGRYCKSGDKTRLYLGSFYTTGTATTEDSLINRYLWNLYNQVPRRLHRCPAYNDNSSNTSYTFTTSTFAEANGSGNGRVNFIHGLPGVVCNMFASAIVVTSATGGANAGLGFDGITDIRAMGQTNTVSYLQTFGLMSAYEGTTAGKHSWVLCGYSQAGTATFYADGSKSVGGGSADYKDTYLEGWIPG